jgi:hypothetical protein
MKIMITCCQFINSELVYIFFVIEKKSSTDSIELRFLIPNSNNGKINDETNIFFFFIKRLIFKMVK